MNIACIIPYPREMEFTGGCIRVGDGFVIHNNSTEFFSADILAWVLSGREKVLPGLVVSTVGAGVPIEINITKQSPLCQNEEWYSLDIQNNCVVITAVKRIGILHALNSLAQLLFCNTGEDGETVLELPCVHISDAPRFKWRGMHLDVARHFMPVPFIKKFIDLLALYKFNVFHWHLTDDQGWRIEIKRFPRLVEVASRRSQTLLYHQNTCYCEYDGIPYQGFYTQGDIVDVVEYAQNRGITIVPEIDMPGHMQAAITAYPEWGNTGTAPGVRTEWGVSEHILNMEDSTIKAMKHILEEVIQLFPGKYIHIGGDEAVKKQWRESEAIQHKIRMLGLADEEELQGWFIAEIGSFLNDNRRALAGWDEILNPGMPDNAIIMSWRDDRGAVKAAMQGCAAINADSHFVYFDHYQSSHETQPLAIGGNTTTRKVYVEYEPVPKDLGRPKSEHILGGQGQLWTEYMLNSAQVEYMAFPRVCALSERLWSDENIRDWEGFKKRLSGHFPFMSLLNINYYRGVLE